VLLDYGRDGYRYRHADHDAPLAIVAHDGSRLRLRFGDRQLSPTSCATATTCTCSAAGATAC